MDRLGAALQGPFLRLCRVDSISGAQLRDVEFGLVPGAGPNVDAVTGVMGLQKDSPVLQAMKEQGILRDLFFSMFLHIDYYSGRCSPP